MEFKDYEFNAHGVDLGQFYESAALVPDGSERPQPTRDPELYYQPSTLDPAPHTAFTLITGIAGEAWATAAKKIGDERDVPIVAVIIGPGRQVTDIYYDWARIREIGEDGALLVRPDKPHRLALHDPPPRPRTSPPPSPDANPQPLIGPGQLSR